MTELLYQNGEFHVTPATFGKTRGYGVYQHAGAHAVCVARIGYPGGEGLKRAIAEADRRAGLAAGDSART